MDANLAVSRRSVVMSGVGSILASGVGTQAVFARTGAGDPNFNLIAEPLMILRREATDQTFASVIEPHGYFSELEERSANARGVVRNVRVLSSTAEASVVEILGDNGLRWVVMVNNGPASATSAHRVVAGGQTFEWTGNFSVLGIR